MAGEVFFLVVGDEDDIAFFTQPARQGFDEDADAAAKPEGEFQTNRDFFSIGHLRGGRFHPAEKRFIKLNVPGEHLAGGHAFFDDGFAAAPAITLAQHRVGD